MTLDEEIKKLEKEIKTLKYEVNVLKSTIYPKSIAWSHEPITQAMNAGLRPSPFGDSLDAKRIIEFLWKIKLIPEKRK